MIEKKLLRKKEAAEYLGVHLNTISYWMRTGQLHPVYHGRIPFIKVDELLGKNEN